MRINKNDTASIFTLTECQGFFSVGVRAARLQFTDLISPLLHCGEGKM